MYIKITIHSLIFDWIYFNYIVPSRNRQMAFGHLSFNTVPAGATPRPHAGQGRYKLVDQYPLKDYSIH